MHLVASDGEGQRRDGWGALALWGILGKFGEWVERRGDECAKVGAEGRMGLSVRIADLL